MPLCIRGSGLEEPFMKNEMENKEAVCAGPATANAPLAVSTPLSADEPRAVFPSTTGSHVVLEDEVQVRDVGLQINLAPHAKGGDATCDDAGHRCCLIQSHNMEGSGNSLGRSRQEGNHGVSTSPVPISSQYSQSGLSPLSCMIAAKRSGSSSCNDDAGALNGSCRKSSLIEPDALLGARIASSPGQSRKNSAFSSRRGSGEGCGLSPSVQFQQGSFSGSFGHLQGISGESLDSFSRLSKVCVLFGCVISAFVLSKILGFLQDVKDVCVGIFKAT